MSTILELAFTDKNKVYSGHTLTDDTGKVQFNVVGKPPIIVVADGRTCALFDGSFIYNNNIDSNPATYTYEFWLKCVSYSGNSAVGGIPFDKLFYNSLSTICYGKPYTVKDGTIWNHYAFCITTNTTTLFLNGKVLGTETHTTPFYAASLSFGGNDVDKGGGYYKLYVRDIRLSDTILYNKDFTPPNSLHPVYHLQEHDNDYYGIPHS